MKPTYAILLTIGLIIVVGGITHLTGLPLGQITLIGTSIWAAVDSKKIGLKRYKSGISCGPIALFILCVLIWIIGFPWYLIMRHKIKSGKAVLKNPQIHADKSAQPEQPKVYPQAIYRSQTIENNNILTLQDVAARLKISVSEAASLVESSELRGIKIGEQWRVKEGALNDFINK